MEMCVDLIYILIVLVNVLILFILLSKEVKYKILIVLVEDLLVFIIYDVFGCVEGDYDFDNDFFFVVGEYSGEMDSEYDYYGGLNDSFFNMDF